MLGLALGASACQLSPYAAIVNGQVISQQAVTSELDAIAVNTAYVQSLETGAQPVLVQGQGSSASHSFNTRFVDDILSRQISFALISQQVAKRHLVITPSDLTLARTDVADSVGGPKVFAAFPKAYQDTLVRDSAELTALESALAKVPVGEAALRRYYDAHRSQFRNICASIIVVGTQAQANQVLAALAKGASFASLATSVSQDPTTRASGGQVGCGPAAAFASHYGAALASTVQHLSSGQVGKPVSTPVGWIVPEVTSVVQLSFSQATPEIRGTLLNPSSPAVVRLIGALQRQAKVTVDPRYGHVSTSGGAFAVVPPAAPPSRDLLLPNGTSSSGGAAG